MVKGVAIKFSSYQETVPKLLKLIKFDQELKKHSRVVIKPHLLADSSEKSTNVEFVEQLLKFAMENRNPGTEILIAEGVDGRDSTEIFEERGYKRLAEKYGIGLVDLNKAECEEVFNSEFLRFDSIMYPKILKDSFLVVMPKLSEDEDTGITGSLHAMLGAYPAKHYKGFFSADKNRMKKHPVRYQIHDILKVQMPNFSLMDASEKGVVLAGIPEEIDKQATKLYGLDWRNLQHLRIIDESFAPKPEKEEI